MFKITAVANLEARIDISNAAAISSVTKSSVKLL
jgi:hypothetical protein